MSMSLDEVNNERYMFFLKILRGQIENMAELGYDFTELSFAIEGQKSDSEPLRVSFALEYPHEWLNENASPSLPKADAFANLSEEEFNEKYKPEES